MSAPAHAEDVFILTFFLNGIKLRELWSETSLLVSQAYPAESIDIIHLASRPFVRVAHEFEAVIIEIPREALVEFRDAEGRPIESIRCPPGHSDRTITNLVHALLPEFHRSTSHSSMFADCIASAILTHVAERYAETNGKSVRNIVGGLHPSQEQAIKHYLSANLTERTTLAAVAERCGISRGYLIRAFALTTGTTPHKWLLTIKLQKARRMLAASDIAIAEVALVCGFSDQSHLTRHFSRHFKQSPANWRASERSRLRSRELLKANKSEAGGTNKATNMGV